MLCPIGQSNEKPPLQALAKWWEYVTNIFQEDKLADKKQLAYDYTRKGNLVAVITDGTAFWDLEILGRLQECRLWRENVLCLKSLQA